jgi:hypothetical protein
VKSEEIAFEHPCFLVDDGMVQRTMTRKCNERRHGCKTRNLVFVALALGLAACTPKAVEPDLAPVIVGGWQAADPASDQVQAAAQFAAANLPRGRAMLAEVISASTQVVAGTNVRMVLRMADGTRWSAIVWQRLDSTSALTEAKPLP